MTHATLVVIGHVDHGKTALVRALTGIETDRLPEERERGLSITPGFAWRALPGGEVDLIDAPGHEDFIRAMAAGASGAQGVLLVVSAQEGVRAQTVEHLRIATWLGLTRGVVALTKADTVETADLAARTAEIGLALAATPLADCPVIACSALTGAGLETLIAALAALPGGPAPPPPPAPFLSIDRAFSQRGAGTVVTGTLLGGAVSLGDTLALLPSGRTVGVRGLQAHGEDAPRIEAGRRAAVNLRGVAVEEISVGDVLCAPDQFVATDRLDVELVLDGGASRALPHLDQVRLLLGTRAAVAGVRLLETRRLEPGERGWAQLRLDRPLVTFAGRRGVIRRLSPAETLGGVVVLDPAPSLSGRRNAGRVEVLRAAGSADVLAITQALALRDGGLASLADAARLSATPIEDLVARLASAFEPIDQDLMASREALGAAEAAYITALEQAHAASPTAPSWPAAVLRRTASRGFAPRIIEIAEARLLQADRVRLVRGRAALTSHDPIAALSEARRARLSAIEASLLAGGASPPDPAEFGDGSDLVELLIASGRVLALVNHALRRTLLYHEQGAAAAGRALADAFPPPAAFTTGEARIALATSRKFIVPLLEYFDARGWTLREGDVRRLANVDWDCIGPGRL